MSRIVIPRMLEASADRVWEVLSDLPNAHLYHPLIEECDMIGEQDRGLGAERVCYLNDGTELVERFVGWEEGRSLTAQILESPLPFREAQLHVRIDPQGEERCCVRVELNYEVRGGVLGRVADSVMLHTLLNRIVLAAVRGLGLHAATDVEIGPEGEASGIAQRRIWRTASSPLSVHDTL